MTYLTTAIEPDEMLTEVRLPAWQPAWGWDVQEVCRREGDFALVGAVAVLHVDAQDVCQMARLVLFGVGDRPLRLPQAEAVLHGQRVEAHVTRRSGACGDGGAGTGERHPRLRRVPQRGGRRAGASHTGDRRCGGHTGRAQHE